MPNNPNRSSILLMAAVFFEAVDRGYKFQELTAFQFFIEKRLVRDISENGFRF